MANRKIDWTEEALWVRNDTDWGGHSTVTNGHIVSEWSDEACMEYVRHYIHDIASVNGSAGYLTDHEQELFNALEMEF